MITFLHLLTNLYSFLVFLLLISSLITVHEFGHFLFCKIFKVHVYEFSIGFGRLIFSKNFLGTKFSIRLFPLGGFVNIDQESQDSQFNKISLFKKIVILLGGVFFNILFAFLLAIFYFNLSDSKKIYLPKISNYTFQSDLVKVGRLITDFELDPRNKDVNDALSFNDNREYLLIDFKDNGAVIRDDDGLEIWLSTEKYEYSLLKVVDVNTNLSNKFENSLLLNDYILSINGIKFKSFEEFNSVLSSLQGKKTTFEILRDGSIFTVEVQIPYRNQSAVILGLVLKEINGNEVSTTQELYILAYENSLVGSTKFILDMLGYQISALLEIIKTALNSKSLDPVSENLGSLPAIADQTYQIFSLGKFSSLLLLMIFLNLSLSIFNLMPIPALDGGQIFILVLQSILKKVGITNISSVKSFLNYISFIF
ncbi:RIP metalloprotease RseP, partial [Candidatus Dojkabacteria bacterium]